MFCRNCGGRGQLKSLDYFADGSMRMLYRCVNCWSEWEWRGYSSGPRPICPVCGETFATVDEALIHIQDKHRVEIGIEGGIVMDNYCRHGIWGGTYCEHCGEVVPQSEPEPEPEPEQDEDSDWEHKVDKIFQENYKRYIENLKQPTQTEEDWGFDPRWKQDVENLRPVLEGAGRILDNCRKSAPSGQGRHLSLAITDLESAVNWIDRVV